MLEHLRIRRYLCYNSNMSKKANDAGNQQGRSGFRNLKPSETYTSNPAKILLCKT